MSSKRNPKSHRFYILGKHNSRPKKRHVNKYWKFSKAPVLKHVTPIHRKARYTTR